MLFQADDAFPMQMIIFLAKTECQAMDNFPADDANRTNDGLDISYEKAANY
jgi:hypothetical protein